MKAKHIFKMEIAKIDLNRQQKPRSISEQIIVYDMKITSDLKISFQLFIDEVIVFLYRTHSNNDDEEESFIVKEYFSFRRNDFQPFLNHLNSQNSDGKEPVKLVDDKLVKIIFFPSNNAEHILLQKQQFELVLSNKKIKNYYLSPNEYKSLRENIAFLQRFYFILQNELNNLTLLINIFSETSLNIRTDQYQVLSEFIGARRKKYSHIRQSAMTLDQLYSLAYLYRFNGHY